ncbi:hypothetical protein BJ742DRAFT_876284 [Cladochytrium replicatum]|nr:hypothetical protein BJ742DRAFT_876284 [Cladochytrium replicatum]
MPGPSTVTFAVRAHVFASRIRIKELFADFDKLRSGYITAAQFRRCLGAAMEKGVVSPLTDEEYDVLGRRYDLKGDGTFKWTSFIESIDEVFGSQKLEQTPTKYIPAPHEVVKPVRPPLSPKSESVFKEVIDRLRSYVKHHGSDLKTWFKDFDKHNNGFITINQFRRGIPQNLLSLEEEDVLLNQYSDEVTGTVNYFKLNTDVNRKVRRQQLVSHAQLVAKLTNTELHEHFLAGLRLSRLGLRSAEIRALLAKYRAQDGQISYRRFCNTIDTVFTIPHLEEKPLADVKPPERSYLVRGSNDLSPEEEVRCSEIIEKYQKIMSVRRLLLAPFFKDFDKVSQITYSYFIGRVTRSHFCRLLSTMKLDVSENDLHILFKKYEDRKNGRLNYMEFIRTIDPENENGTPTQLQADPKKIMDRLRYDVLAKRTRVSEFFRDFDKLRRYCIPRQEFIRGINRIGLNLTEEEYETIADHYNDSTEKDCCRWKDFEQDIERVFGETGLEARPSVLPKPALVKSSPFLTIGGLSKEERAVLSSVLSRMREHLTLRQISIKPFFKDFDKLCTGHVSRPQFRQCLTYMNVNVTDAEFDVLCKRWSKSVSEGGIIAISGNDRVCYLTFLKELDEGILNIEVDNPENEAKSRHNRELQISGNKEAEPGESLMFSEQDFENLMKRIKTKAKTERVRVIDFMRDFDHLRHGKIKRDEFRRGLKLLFFNMTELELTTLETVYQCKADPHLIEYVKFSDAIESVFTTREVELDPRSEPRTFTDYRYESGAEKIDRVLKLPELRSASGEEERRRWNVEQKARFGTVLSGPGVLDWVLIRLAEKVRRRRIDVLNALEDFDFVGEGSITTNHFRSVLNNLNLSVDDQEILALAQRFAINPKLDRINYRAFSTAISKSLVVDGASMIRDNADQLAYQLW